MQYYVLIKRKGSKSYVGAIKAKPKAPKRLLENMIRRELKAGFSGKVVTRTQLSKALEKSPKLKRARASSRPKPGKVMRKPRKSSRKRVKKRKR